MGVEGGGCSALPITQRVLESSEKEINYNMWDDSLCQAILLIQQIKWLHKEQQNIIKKYFWPVHSSAGMQLTECHFLWSKLHLWDFFQERFPLLHYISDIYHCAHSTGKDYKSPKIGFHSQLSAWTPFGLAAACRNRYEYLFKGWANASESQSITNTLGTKELVFQIPAV